MSDRETYKQMAPILPAHRRHPGRFVTKKKKEQRIEGRRCQNIFGFHKVNSIEDTNNG